MSLAKKFKVLITNPKTPRQALLILQEKCDVIICESKGLVEPPLDEILSKCKGMDGILWSTHVCLDAVALDAAGPQLKAISTLSAGLDFVDVAELKRRAIPLGHTPFVLNNAVADLAVGLLIAAARRFHEGFKKIVGNDWQNSPQWLLGRDIQHSTVGIVGLGGIGQTIAQRLTAFGVGKFLYTGRTEKPEAKQFRADFVPFDELLRKSDFVIVACPLTPETKGLFNKAAFEKMKPTSVFINIARGGIVVQDDLVEALKNHTIFSAGLDVVTPEPLPPNHPLTQLDNCVLVPHLGTATNRTEDDMASIAAHNILNALKGEEMVSPVYKLFS